MARAILAALLAAAVASCAQEPQAVPRSSVEALVGVSPSGEASWPIVFRWEGAEAREVVRVRLVDEAERPLFGIEARGTEVRAPDAMQKVLEPGERYGWRVSRVDENGEAAGTSDLVTFVFQ